jgi:general stress protein YciG
MPRFTNDTAAALGRKGGQATAQRHGRDHMARIGRKGFHAMVRKHYGGDYRRAINTLIARGLMALDPVPQNGAWTKARVSNRLPADYVPPAEDEPFSPSDAQPLSCEGVSVYRY